MKLFDLRNESIESAVSGVLNWVKRDEASEADSGENWCLSASKS